MREKAIEKVFEKIKSIMIDRYQGDSFLIEKIIDIDFRHCVKAERDHHRDLRIYMHIGCEDLTICTSSSINLLSLENLQGLFCHEIGHIIHTQLPDIFESIADNDEIEILNDIGDPEIIADCIIDRLFDIHIYYDHKKVQWTML